MQSIQGSHRLEKCLNIEVCLEKSLIIKAALKSTRKSLLGLEKSLNFTTFCPTFNTVNGDFNQFKIVVT